MWSISFRNQDPKIVKPGVGDLLDTPTSAMDMLAEHAALLNTPQLTARSVSAYSPGGLVLISILKKYE